ncbi:hypothetical protein [Flavobacterium sp.]|jgi:hypothetical protein|uniref:hypothetical protein n=1 Tax=Flavobacterium sp. TaxID=239 RepID=UPI0037C0219E
MKNTIQNLDELKFEKKINKIGYGKFPYIIYKSGHAIYMKIPIHFNRNNDFDNYPSIHINGIDKFLLKEHNSSFKGELHDVLIESSIWVKNQIEEQTKKAVKIFLVDAIDKAHFFEGDEIKFSSKIACGGTLISQEGKILGMNVNHFI